MIQEPLSIKKFMHRFTHNALVAGMSIVVLSLALVLIGVAATKNTTVKVSSSKAAVLTPKPSSKPQVAGVETNTEPTNAVATSPVPATTSNTSPQSKKPTATPPSPSQPPAKKPTPGPVDPTPAVAVQTYVKSASVTIGACGGSYTYSITLYGTTSTTLSARWEIVSGESLSDLSGLPTAYPIPGQQWRAGDITISDTRSPGLQVWQGHPYSARIHITSPSDFYSNTVNIPGSC